MGGSGPSAYAVNEGLRGATNFHLRRGHVAHHQEEAKPIRKAHEAFPRRQENEEHESPVDDLHRRSQNGALKRSTYYFPFS